MSSNKTEKVLSSKNSKKKKEETVSPDETKKNKTARLLDKLKKFQQASQATSNFISSKNSNQLMSSPDSLILTPASSKTKLLAKFIRSEQPTNSDKPIETTANNRKRPLQSTDNEENEINQIKRPTSKSQFNSPSPIDSFASIFGEPILIKSNNSSNPDLRHSKASKNLSHKATQLASANKSTRTTANHNVLNFKPSNRSVQPLDPNCKPQQLATSAQVYLFPIGNLIEFAF